MVHYDIVVIGSGPAGQKAAIQAAKLKKRVAIIDRPHALGGRCIYQGAIPSKTLREAILFFTGFYSRQPYATRRQHLPSVQELLTRCTTVVDNEARIILRQLERNRVDVFEGEAALADAHTVRVNGAEESLTADIIILSIKSWPTVTSCQVIKARFGNSRYYTALNSRPKEEELLMGPGTETISLARRRDLYLSIRLACSRLSAFCPCTVA